MSEDEKKCAEKSKTVITFGGAWTNLFETSLSRQMAGILHLPLGNPRFKLSPEVYTKLTGKEDSTRHFLDRLNNPSRQASEILFRLKWFMTFADLVLVDCTLLDTALGHQILVYCQELSILAYGVGVDDCTSPLAAAYLKGIVYPTSADDLVKLALPLKE